MDAKNVQAQAKSRVSFRKSGRKCKFGSSRWEKEAKETRTVVKVEEGTKIRKRGRFAKRTWRGVKQNGHR